MTADGDRGWEESWEESWKESWGDATYEDDEAQTTPVRTGWNPPVLCAKAALEILAEFLDCSPNAARKRFDAWKRRSSKGTRKLRSGLGQIGRWIRFGKRTRAALGVRLIHEITVSAHIGRRLKTLRGVTRAASPMRQDACKCTTSTPPGGHGSGKLVKTTSRW